MDHYAEIRLLPDPEFASTVLMNALVAKLHRALVQLQSRSIGVSFPDVQPDHPTLGQRLRLHGSSVDLQRLLELDWLAGMRDHSALCGPAAVPQTDSYRIVRRVQAKSSPERLRRRRVRRAGISPDEALRAIPDRVAEQLRLPYVTVSSRSTGQTFRLFIDHQVSADGVAQGTFSYYGLSPTASIPWF
jgi:CRISPR-associated endonuclease Csy4